MSARVSKSAVLKQLGCPLRAYLAIRHPKLAAPVNPTVQMRLDEGRAVGEAARVRYLDGVLVREAGLNTAAVRRTRKLIDGGTSVLFEAAFVAGGAGVRVDILRALPNGRWHLIEVKSSKTAKDENDLDLAVQWHVVRAAGLNVTKASLCLLDGRARAGDPDPFRVEDRTSHVKACLARARAAIRALGENLASGKPPGVALGPQCLSPEVCGFQGHCWKRENVPAVSVLDLPGATPKKRWALYHAGIRSLSDVPAAGLTPRQRRAVRSAREGELLVDRTAVADEITSWPLPHYHLDFETIAPAIPRFPGVGPYGVVPVQFSALIDDGPGGTRQPRDYLHKHADDPRDNLCDQLLAVIPAKGGSVVAYNATYEKGVLQSLAERFPARRMHLESIVKRLRDPLPLVREHVYHPAFGGSFSIKVVGKVVLGPGADYAKLAIHNGLEAVMGYEEMTSPDCPTSRRDELYARLIEYCRQDTRVMQELLAWMRSLRP